MPVLSNLPVEDAGVTAFLGYGVVFLGLVLLMIVISLVGKIFAARDRKKTETVVAEEVPAVEAPKPAAPGAAGEIKLHNVDPKTAAMLMAIVADKLGKPLNELRFLSIKEVE